MTLLRSVLLGFFTGLRSMSAMAALIVHSRERAYARETNLPSWTRTPIVAALARLGQAGELIMDKLPFTPARTSPVALLGRTMLGGLVGLWSNRERSYLSALLSAIAAIAGSFAGYYVRTRITRNTGLPDPVVAGLEDALTLVGPPAVMNLYERPLHERHQASRPSSPHQDLR